MKFHLRRVIIFLHDIEKFHHSALDVRGEYRQKFHEMTSRKFSSDFDNFDEISRAFFSRENKSDEKIQLTRAFRLLPKILTYYFDERTRVINIMKYTAPSDLFCKIFQEKMQNFIEIKIVNI